MKNCKDQELSKARGKSKNSGEEEAEDENGAVSSDEGVKSKAVVKYSAAIVPAPFTLLQSNTDLNLPPPNWLSNSVAMYGVPNRILSRTGFSSFAMANRFPDCIGAVDVVSDAENIKKLLKMAYSSSPISLIIHRIENTLLIDDFDVKKALLASEGRWGFFRKFFEHVMKSMQVKPENVVEYKDKSRTALQGKSLISKFFYHSLVPTPDVAARQEPPKVDPNVAIPLPFLESEPQLPEPRVEEELPDPASSHKFSRNVVWTFEDIQMLLGTDIPIFGGSTHPCISLKLRDMSKPINVLTGMDYWLDNLMCNVPEVVMCYHLNGIVQRYELIKTEDLPHLPNSKFSPKVVRDIAQNILSFLKANATKSGHTYWLFKGRDDDVVKLYDLTCLCGDVLEEGQTPFTVPVAMLLYRVARNMKHQDGRRQAPTVCTLLRNCVALLPEEKYPEIATSAHYMLADVYLPGDVDPRHPDLEDSGESTASEAEPESDEYLAVRSTSLAAIREPQDEPQDTPQPAPPPLSSDVNSRCTDALKHVLNGLRLLSKMNASEPEMVNPSEAIPMPCGTPQKSEVNNKSPLDESPTAVLRKPPVEAVPCEEWSWAEHLKALLLEKAAVVYLTLIEYAFNMEEFGVTLRRAGMAMRVLTALENLRGVPSRWEGRLYGRAGDALLTIVKRGVGEMLRYDEAYHQPSEMDDTLQKLLRQEGESTDLPSLLPPALDGLEPLLQSSAACYSRAVAVETDKNRRNGFYRLLGNVKNELGVFYMDQAWAVVKASSESDGCPQVGNLLEASQAHLDEGVVAFTHVDDSANLALLYSNTGRLMRLRAHCQAAGKEERTETATQKRVYYNKAISIYQRAIEVLGERSKNPPVWDCVYWELSTAFYSLATLLQDYPAGDKSHEDSERELTDALHKALKYIDLETTGVNLPIYQFRAAQIHHRLASLHHCQYRHSSEEGKKKHVVQLAKLHYEKAARLLQLLDGNCPEALTVQMERIGLAELLAEGSSSVGTKVKHLTHALELMVELLPALQSLSEEGDKTDLKEDEKTDADGEDCEKAKQQSAILALMLQRLQFILLTLIKITGKKTGDKKSGVAENYKSLYGAALQCSRGATDSVRGLSKGLVTVLSQLPSLSAR